MAYGSCKRCGNSREECECPGAPTQARIDVLREKNDAVINKMLVNSEGISKFVEGLRAGKR